ncbi:MAG: LysR family transcriptional regulator [Bacteroidetes bacterium GWD2_45_23]|nr:MAG: LysR family transcriptional regulator [Bacteroidetes bacterium GWC2_46_850]OFX69604.1 MAG: LysR family transcriptional regulator [Bacteroidetes bacterium GWC1_47_7]OFX87340.1 MAG: LysR family transcriptional regulator [Bacteroidetes bacterium GWD2_45_23]HBB01624.1 LysR family transcriptional regulator [Porphyromonadaceae bacterium]HCC17206.1 LysR family transcriptional regulator [Porphyromonadaceae bacterium]
MDYRDTVFLLVAEQRSFSKAAESLHISQPAVSRHIKEMELHYDASLFDRKGNRIYLTAAGEKVYHALREIAQHYRNLNFEMGEMHSVQSGEIIIGASSTIAQYVIPRVMASFHKRYSHIQLHLMNGNSSEMEQLLLDNRVDLALVENLSSQGGIRYRDFLHDELIVVTGKNSLYAERATIEKEDLQQIPLVLREEGSGTLEVIRQLFARHQIPFRDLNTPIHLGSTESIKNFLLDFNGLAIISEKAVQNELYLKTLVKLQVTDIIFPRKFRIAQKIGHKSRLTDLFVQYLLNYRF